MRTYRIGMLLRRFSFARNPLRRRSDRIESAVLIALVTLLGLAVPLAGQVNDIAYESHVRTTEQRATTSVRTVAVLQQDAPRLEGPATRGPVQKPRVRVAWLTQDGAAREGTVEVSFGTPAGTRIPVWTDRSGDLVPTPMTTVDIRSRAIVAATVSVLGWALVLAIVFVVVRKVLDQFRLRAWDDGWGQVEPRWRRPTRW